MRYLFLLSRSLTAQSRINARVPHQATEDNEMSLVEGELIEQIEEVDEGWWSGVGQGGAKTGLFPGMSPDLMFQVM